MKYIIQFVLIIASKYDTITKLLYLYSECNQKTAMFCTRIREDGTKKRFLNYFFNGNICTLLLMWQRLCIILISIFLSYIFITLLITYEVSFIKCPAGYYGRNCSLPCSLQNMEATVLKKVLVHVHPVILSMAAI